MGGLLCWLLVFLDLTTPEKGLHAPTEASGVACVEIPAVQGLKTVA